MEEEKNFPIPQVVLDRRIWNDMHEVLIHRKGLSSVDATWEYQEIIKGEI